MMPHRNAHVLIPTGCEHAPAFVRRPVALICLFLAVAPLSPGGAAARIAEQRAPANVVAVAMRSYVRRALGDLLDAWKTQLEHEGLNVVTWTVADGATPAQIRDRFIALRPRIQGAVLIGRMPIPYTLCPTNDQTTSYYHYTPCDHYYQDLDGLWESPVSLSRLRRYAYQDETRAVKFDWRGAQRDDFRVQLNWKRYRHQQERKRQSLPDIYVGRITAEGYTTNGAVELQLLRAYFERDLAYRRGVTDEPSRALYVEAISHGDAVNAQRQASHGMRFEGLCEETRYFVNRRVQYAALLARRSRLLFFTAHGGVAMEADGPFTAEDVLRCPPQARFVLINGCGACDFDRPASLGAAYLHAPGCRTLAVMGFPVEGGFNNLEFFSQALQRSGGRTTVGAAWQVWCRENIRRIYLPGYFVFLGDPTLPFSPRLSWQRSSRSCSDVGDPAGVRKRPSQRRK